MKLYAIKKREPFLTLLSLMLFATSSVSAQTTGAATAYDVTINKVELCSDPLCQDAVTVGSSATKFDIASGGAGSAIGSYASLNDLPKGTTVTHVRITLSRTLGIVGTVADPGNVGGVCGTDSSDNSSTVNAAGVGLVGGAGTNQRLVVPTEASIFGQPPVGTYAAQNLSIISPTEMRFLKALPASFTMGDTPPVVDIAFETAAGVSAFDSNAGAPGGDCWMFPAAPIVRISTK